MVNIDIHVRVSLVQVVDTSVDGVLVGEGPGKVSIGASYPLWLTFEEERSDRIEPWISALSADLRARIKRTDFFRCELLDDDLMLIARALPSVEDLIVARSEIRGWTWLTGLPSTVEFLGVKLSNDCAAFGEGVRELRSLSRIAIKTGRGFDSAEVFRALSSLPNLREVVVTGAYVGSEALAELRQLRPDVSVRGPARDGT